MPVRLVSEEELRSALRLYRVQPDAFEDGVRARLATAQSGQIRQGGLELSPLLRIAAAFLPLTILTGCKETPDAAKEAPAGILYTLAGYLAFPAISLFVLLGATIFSARAINRSKLAERDVLHDTNASQDAIHEWWRQNKRGALAVFVATLISSVLGATWLLFLFYLISFALLLYVIASLAALGLGSREIVGRSCAMGLMFLSQTSFAAGMGDGDIHFLDQRLLGAALIGGSLAVSCLSLDFSSQSPDQAVRSRRWTMAFVVTQLILSAIVWSAYPSWLLPTVVISCLLVLYAWVALRTRSADSTPTAAASRTSGIFFATIATPLMLWMGSSVLWPATNDRIKNYVESFDRARFDTSSWSRFEIAASWTIDAGLKPDLSKPRQLLKKELASRQNPYILSAAFRLGMVEERQLDQLKDYDRAIRSLVELPTPEWEPGAINGVEHSDWVIHAAVLRNDLSPQELDILEKRLLATLEGQFENPHGVLSESLRVTQLLEVLGRPVDRDLYRQRIHYLLMKFHTKESGGFQRAGGFTRYLPQSAKTWISQPGSLDATGHAIQLMQVYGIPENLDINWVRSFLRPSTTRWTDSRWTTAATLNRLRSLPGVTEPTWIEYLYYERALLAAVILVVLCAYATVRSPIVKRVEASHASQP